MTLSETVLRQATPEDVKAIAEVHVQGWRWAYRGLMPEAWLQSLSVPAREKQWRDFLSPEGGRESTGRRVWVGEREGRVVGFVQVGRPWEREHGAGVGELGAIYVAKDVAGTGVGAALMNRAIDDMRQDGFQSVYLWVLDTNARARRFYEKCGWVTDGGTKQGNFGGAVVHEVRYRRSL